MSECPDLESEIWNAETGIWAFPSAIAPVLLETVASVVVPSRVTLDNPHPLGEEGGDPPVAGEPGEGVERP